MFSALLATAGYLVFAMNTSKSTFFVPAVLSLTTFLLSFTFTSVFQLVRKCPFNPVSVSVASGATTAFILFVIGLLSFSWTGSFLLWIVESAFPYVADPTKVQTEVMGQYSDKDIHVFSHGYSYWMFWAGLLPMYTFLGFIGSC